MKEHRAAAHLGQLEKSAVAEHARQDGHVIDWSDVRILDAASRNSALLIKEALRSTEEKINRDLGLDVLSATKLIDSDDIVIGSVCVYIVSVIR